MPTVIFQNPPIYIILDNQKMAGFIAVKKHRKINELGTLYIYPDMRGKGYAKELIATAKKEYAELYLHCKTDLISFYSSSGFNVIDTPNNMMQVRKRIFNLFLAPILKYKIVVMRLG